MGDATIVLFKVGIEHIYFIRSMVIKHDSDKKNKSVAIKEARYQAIRFLIGREYTRTVKNRTAIEKLQKAKVPFTRKVTISSLKNLELFEVSLLNFQTRKEYFKWYNKRI